MRPPSPPENSATETVPSAAARIGVTSGTPRPRPARTPPGSPVIGCTRGPKSLVLTQVSSGSGNTTRDDAAAGADTGAFATGTAALSLPLLLPPVRVLRMVVATGA